MFEKTLSPLLKPFGGEIKILRKRKRNEISTSTLTSVDYRIHIHWTTCSYFKPGESFLLFERLQCGGSWEEGQLIYHCCSNQGAVASDNSPAWNMSPAEPFSLIGKAAILHSVYITELENLFLPFHSLLLCSNDSRVCKLIAKFFFSFSETWCNLWIAE